VSMAGLFGLSLLLEELLYKPAHSLIDQSMHARLGATTTNGDGFGVGWYTSGDTFRAPRRSSGPQRALVVDRPPPA
jgi:predicted glutamine amidotransferase